MHMPKGQPVDRAALETELQALCGEVPDPDASLPVPSQPAAGGRAAEQVADDIVFGETIARGASGWIRAAQQRSLDRTVAVKSLLPTRDNATHVDGLLREAVLAGQLDHPNIVPVHSLGLSPEAGPFLVMKRIVGDSLEQQIAAGPPLSVMDETAARRELDRLATLMRAVEYAHSRGIVHNDIKPGNVLVGRFGELHLVDWGSAVALDTDSPSRLRAVVGTPAYIAPEQLDPEREVDPRTDVFLLGATVYHRVTGEPLHGHGSVIEVLERAAGYREPVLTDAVPPELAAVIRRACHVDPAQRYQTVADLREALQGFVELRATYERLRGLADRFAQAADRPASERRGEYEYLWWALASIIDQYPGAAGAQALLARVQAAAVELELADHNPAGAQGLLERMAEPPPSLSQAVRQATAEAAASAEALDRLAAEEARERFRVTDWSQSIMAASAGTLSLVVALAVANWGREAAEPELLPLGLVLFGVGLWTRLVTWLLRNQSMMQSPRYRRFCIAFELIFYLGALATVLGALCDVPFRLLAAFITLIGVSSAGVMAVTLDRVLLSSALLASLVLVAGTVWPVWFIDFIGVGFFLNGVYLSWALRPGAEPVREQA